jgi:uncharacterized RDD family membrane protein YckC
MNVTADRFDSELRAGARVSIPTPEGVPLVFTVASIGERAYAFTIDCLFAALWLGGIVVVAMVAASGRSGVLAAIALLAFFLLRNGWFLGHELRSGGRTPGKRRAQLRVIDAHGGALRPQSIVVRNLTREVEVFVPIVVLGNPEFLVSTGPAFVRVLAVLWVAGFALVPFFDPRRRRIGDLLGGTLVVRDPRATLEADLTAEPSERRAPTLAFSAAQLALYGIYELQVLENLLRDPATSAEAVDAVAARVQKKLGWTGSLHDAGAARAFLEAFYGAQRARLEHDLTLGRARERKDAPPGARAVVPKPKRERR